MHAEKLPAAQGWQWVQSGLRLFLRQPLPLFALLVTSFIGIGLVAALPIVGEFLPLILQPAISVGMMVGVRRLDQREVMSPMVLIEPLRAEGGRHARPLLVLGGVYMAGFIAALAFSVIGDGGKLFQMFMLGGHLDPADMQQDDLRSAFMLWLLAYVPIMMAFWYAPMLVLWDNIPPLKALFFSFVTVWRNKGTFLVYSLAWAGVAIAIAWPLGVLMPALGLPASAGSVTILFVTIPLASSVVASFYYSYTGVFHRGHPPAPGPAASGAEPPAGSPPADL